MLFTFRKIVDHQGPLKPKDPRHRGSSWNAQVEWEDGTKTWEASPSMIAADPATMAAHAKDHDPLDTPGWKRLKRIAKRAKALHRMVKASKRAQRYNEIAYKFGVRVPRSVKEA